MTIITIILKKQRGQVVIRENTIANRNMQTIFFCKMAGKGSAHAKGVSIDGHEVLARTIAVGVCVCGGEGRVALRKEGMYAAISNACAYV